MVVHAARVEGEVVGIAVARKGLEGLQVRGRSEAEYTVSGVSGLVEGGAHDLGYTRGSVGRHVSGSVSSSVVGGAVIAG